MDATDTTTPEEWYAIERIEKAMPKIRAHYKSNFVSFKIDITKDTLHLFSVSDSGLTVCPMSVMLDNMEGKNE